LGLLDPIDRGQRDEKTAQPALVVIVITSRINPRALRLLHHIGATLALDIHGAELNLAQKKGDNNELGPSRG
jgi:hypothetical protein